MKLQKPEKFMFQLKTKVLVSAGGDVVKAHLDSRRRSVGVDEQQRRRPLAAEQEVKCVVVSHGSHMQQVTTRGRKGGAGVQH